MHLYGTKLLESSTLNLLQAQDLTGIRVLHMVRSISCVLIFHM